MRVFVSIERHDPFRIVALADVAAAWERNDRGYGCYGRGSIPYPGDRSLEITLNLRVRPYRRFSIFSEFPPQLEQTGKLVYDGDDRLGLYAVAHGRAGVLIAAGALQRELEQAHDEAFHFEKVCIARNGLGRIQLNVSIAVLSAPAEPVGDIPEWNTQFFQGGLPSLGKRRP